MRDRSTPARPRPARERRQRALVLAFAVLVLGGTVDRTSTTGVPYTSTLGEHRTPVDVG